MSSSATPTAATVAETDDNRRDTREVREAARPLSASRLTVAAVASISVVGLALAIRIGRPSDAIADPMPLLVALAALCTAALLRRRAQGGAWFALVIASFVAAHIPTAISRAADPGTMDLAAWIVIAVEATAAAVVTMAVAVMYATRPERRAFRGAGTIAVALAVWLAAACMLVIAVTVTGGHNDPAFTWLDVATGPTAFFFHFVLLLTALGVAGDLRAAAERAERRMDARAASAPGGGVGGVSASPVERVRATIRELIPGEADAGDAAIEVERTNLAGDLHASVLPGLRRAIADAEAGGSADGLADRLRDVATEIERLMTDRWPVVLDSLGLVAAVEDLAERIERDSELRVEIDVEADDGRRPPRPVERAAWRIVELAVDNAVRHAGATALTIRIGVAPERVVLSVADDGRGIAKSALRRGGRGVPDMEARARAVGGRLRIAPGEDRGTVVTFDWPSTAGFGT